MNETIKTWFHMLYQTEIGQTRGTISNEHLWEVGYDGVEPNPHTQNIETLNEYLDMLTELDAKLDKEEITQ